MQNHTNQPDSSAFLVNIGSAHVLVDALGERLLVLNGAAARVWSQLVSGVPPRSPASQSFARELVALQLVPELTMPEATETDGDDVPWIQTQVPLQVAANTSDPNPFSSDSSW